MGTFGCYTGSTNIPKEKRELFCNQVEKILNYGGMCESEEVKLYDTTVYLLKPVKINDEEVYFHYNYFEDDGWETASFDPEDTDFSTGKIGSFEFNDVVTAVYMLYELYSGGEGLAMIDGDVVDTTQCVAWINNLLGTKFSMAHRFDLWRLAEGYALNNLKYTPALSNDVLYSIIPRGMIDVAGGTEFTDLLYIINGTDSLTRMEVESDSYAELVLDCKELLKEYYDKYAETGEADIIKLICKKRDEREKVSCDLKALANMTLILPARVFGYLTAELENKKFWPLWKEIYKNVYHDEVVESYASEKLQQWRNEQRFKPIEPMSTKDYLTQTFELLYRDGPEEVQKNPRPYLEDADRLYWWDGTPEVEISREMDEWLNQLSIRHKELLNKDESLVSEQEFLRDFMELLSSLNTDFGRIYPFYEMFYDFLKNSSKKEYRAAIELLKILADENRKEGEIIKHMDCSWGLANRKITRNIARLRIKRYLSVMANIKLREKYFGF